MREDGNTEKDLPSSETFQQIKRTVGQHLDPLTLLLTDHIPAFLYMSTLFRISEMFPAS